MTRTYLRPFTDEERRQIEDNIAAVHIPTGRAELLRAVARSVIGHALLGLAFGACALPFLQRRVTYTMGVVCTVLGTFTASGAFLGYHAYRKERAYQEDAARRTVEYWRERLDLGQYEVTEVTASEVAVVLPADDEAPMFFFSVGDGEVVCLSGDHLQDDGEDLAVPCAFSLLRFPGVEGIVEVVESGPRFAPTRVLSPDAFDDGYYPEDGEVIPARLQTLRADLKRLADAC
ncbi:MAG TPA: hypothetical protein VM490_21915 [Armatimonadaceae bacterium]|nr:hypothetical protein [Armatimonadaceae bacterium]